MTERPSGQEALAVIGGGARGFFYEKFGFLCRGFQRKKLRKCLKRLQEVRDGKDDWILIFMHHQTFSRLPKSSTTNRKKVLFNEFCSD